jgi:hypothetical protein
VALEPLYIHKEEWVVDYFGDRIVDRVVDRVGSKTVVRTSDSVRQFPTSGNKRVTLVKDTGIRVTNKTSIGIRSP